jgi:three-Cys-motif partner protein
MVTNSFLTIKPHTLHKYNILKKYIGVCKLFDKYYSNFVYVDTHGGSGKVQLEGEGSQWVDGSPLIAGNWTPSFPCHIVEIDPSRYGSLCASTNNCRNVSTYNGDCNELIPSILANIPKGRKFVFCFIDPESLVYHGNNGDFDQLRADTVRAIANFPRTEILLNFPLESLLRCAGDYYSNPNEHRAISTAERVTTFMGSESWKNLAPNKRERKDFLLLFMNEMLSPYQFKGAMLVRSQQNNLPLYYLVYSTHNYTAAKIMRDIMKKEGDFGLYYDLMKERVPTLDEAYPLAHFVFERD